MNSPFPVYQEEQANVDLTPMLDVVFIMLIFFVVTATFLNELGVPVAAPPIAIDAPQDVESITVIVEPGGVFNVNGRLLSKDSLAPYVRALHAENPEAPYSVRVVSSAKVVDTVTAVDAGRMIGLSVVPIARSE